MSLLRNKNIWYKSEGSRGVNSEAHGEWDGLFGVGAIEVEVAVICQEVAVAASNKGQQK